MLGIKEDGEPFGFQEPDRFLDDLEVIFKCGLQYLGYLPVPGLTHNIDRFSAGLHQSQQAGVLTYFRIHSPGAAESHHDNIL